MTYNHLTLFCLVDGESASSVFPVKLPMDDSIGDLKKLIKTEKAPEFDDIAADKLTLWRVSISVATNKHKLIVLNEFESAAELDPTDDVSDVFPEAPPKKTIHIIVQRPPPVNAPVTVPLRARSYACHPRVRLLSKSGTGTGFSCQDRMR